MKRCDCCGRALPFESFSGEGWCADCSGGDCEPWRPGRLCPRQRAGHKANLGVLARGARAVGRVVFINGEAT